MMVKVSLMTFLQAVVDAHHHIMTLLTQRSRDDASQIVGIGFGGDLTRWIDARAEEILIDALLPFGMIQSEERGAWGDAQDSIIIIDPLDGSDNFALGIPYYGTSIAWVKDGEIRAACVSNLIAKTLQYREGDYEAMIDLVTHERFPLRASAYAKGVGIFERGYRHPDLGDALWKAGYKWRSMGALALSLSLASSVDFVLFVGPQRIFDTAAGEYLSHRCLCYKSEHYLLLTRTPQTARVIKQILQQGGIQ